jgi:hypothetical protein
MSAQFAAALLRLAKTARHASTCHSAMALDDNISCSCFMADLVVVLAALGQHEREIRAQALREAAARIGPELASEVGGHTSTYSVRRWLHGRADALAGGHA